MTYFSSRLLQYATNANGSNTDLDYGEVSQVITDKLINVNMGGSDYVLEAVSVESGYIPRVGDWVVVEWQNNNPVARGTSATGQGLYDINIPKIVSTSDLASGTINSDHIRTDTIEARHIQAGSITAQAISANSIQTEHISANSITGQQIQSNTITSDNIKAGSIGATSISANAISSVNIQANAIQSYHISSNSIVSDSISSNAIQTRHISANTITAGMIQANAITTNAISANSIYGNQIVGGQIQGYHISANSINGNQIIAGSIQTYHISANSITSSLVQANAIGANHITANAIGANQITANAIQSRHISSNSILANMISANQINASHISANSIQSNMISSNQVQAQHISSNSIQTQHISSNTIVGYQIQANQISGNHLVAGTIDASKLTVGTLQQGLLGQYYTYTANASNKFLIFKGSQIDPTINFSWGTGSPSIVGQSDYYAVRWQGFISAPESGSFQFIVTADEGTTLTINNSQIINNWNATNGAPVTGNISLTQNNFYPIMLEYLESTGNSNIKLEWIRPSLTREVVPSRYLTQGNTVIDGATIRTGTVTASQMQVGTITAQSGILANAVIQTANIADGIITSAKIGNGEIKTANIASGNITNALIADATIDHAKIASVDASTITVGHLDGSIITAGTISGNQIAAQSITGDRIGAGQIDTTQLKAGSVITQTIASGAITTDKIEAGAVTGDIIRAGSITAEHISTVGLDAQLMSVYDSKTGETLIGGGYLRVDGLDAGVVQSDNLLKNGLFLTSSMNYGYIRMNPSGEALLGDTQTGEGSHQVWKIDLTSGNVVKKIDIPSKQPVDVVVHPSGNYAYITVNGDNTLVQLDLAQDMLTNSTLPMGVGPARAKFTGQQLMDMKHIFVLNTDSNNEFTPDSMTVIDTPPDSVNGDLYVHHQIELGTNPYDFVIDSNHQTWITLAGAGEVVMVDTSNMDSHTWKIKGRIPITAYGTDLLHGGLDATFGLQEVTGGDASGQYNDSSMSQMNMSMTDSASGYGQSDGSLRQYTPQGIEQSSDSDTLYVVDSFNGELVVLDKLGSAPYNALIGTSPDGSFQSGNSMSMTSGGSMSMSSSGPSPAQLKSNGEANGGGPGTYWVRYRIPVGDSPDFVRLVNGKLFITLSGSNSLAVIDESAILNEISADRNYYGTYLGNGTWSNWNVFQPMRTVNNIPVRMVMNVGTSPTFMNIRGNNIYVSLSNQSQIAVIDSSSEMVMSTINVGTNPRGFDFTPDGKYMYVANYGGVEDLSFIYPQGTYIGDPYMALEGGINYQGADGWTPDRSDWVYDASGNIQSKSVIEFHINEPLKNEGGYAKISSMGIDSQYAKIEQDIVNAENYSNGDNVINVIQGHLVPDYSGNIWSPQEGQWLNSPAVTNINICSLVSGNTIKTLANPSTYTINYGTWGNNNSNITFSPNVVPSGNWIEADYTAPNNIYFKTQNSSAEVAIDFGSSPNFAVSYQVDEFVPKFVAVDNQQTAPFTPTADGINEEYTGLEYSIYTNRALNIPSGNITTNGTFVGDSTVVVDGDTTSSNYVATNLVSGGAYIDLDLGSTYMIGQVKVWHYYSDGRTYHNTKTEVSEDGINWTAVFDSAVSGEYAETSSGNVITFNALPVRYIRDWLNGNTVNSSNHWVEIQALGDWELESGYTYPSNSPKSGQQIATNGKYFVSTDIHDAYIAMDIQIEFTSWWYMTYVVGPEFGKIKIDMPTLMNSSHYLTQTAPFINNIAHRHIMPFPPSAMVQANDMKNIKAGKHRAIIRQVSGKVTLDRLRFEDFQYYNRSTLSIPTNTSATLFTRYKVVAQQAQWYKGQGRQSTEGAYDTPRTNPDTGNPDYSVPIKYRVRFLTQLSPTGSVREQGTAYITSAIFETGKLSTHWRRSESSDVLPSHQIESWNSQLPFTTGIQKTHLADGAVTAEKILVNSIMDWNISNYARIQEHKLQLNYPTHQHGWYTVKKGAGPMGSDLQVWNDNLSILDSIQGWAGTSGNYGTGNVMARGDHLHDVAVSGGANGFIDGTNYGKLLRIQDNAINQATTDSLYMSLSGGNILGKIFVKSGNSYVLMGGDSNGSIELGNVSGTVVTPFIDFHTGSNNDYDARIIASGGLLSGNGKATINISASDLQLNGASVATKSWISGNYLSPTTSDARYLHVSGGTMIGHIFSDISSSELHIGFESGNTPTSYLWGRTDSTGYWDYTNNHGIWRYDFATQTFNIQANGGVVYNGSSVWYQGNLSDPATKTWISGNYYNKSDVDSKIANAGNVDATKANTFNATNTFNNAGLSIKIQPSAGVANATKLMQINDASSNELFSVNYSGGVVVAGDLTVTGQTKYSGTTSVNGDYSISGNLFVSGNSTLGSVSTDTTTINGTLVVNGDVHQTGYYQEVHRRPLYGIAGDLQFQTSSTAFDSIVLNYDPNVYANPSVKSGATRYYRMYVVYSDDITSAQVSGGQVSTLMYSANSTLTWNLPATWGDPNGRRDWYSPYFSNLPVGNVTLYAMLAQSGNNLGIRWIELIAYDKF